MNNLLFNDFDDYYIIISAERCQSVAQVFLFSYLWAIEQIMIRLNGFHIKQCTKKNAVFFLIWWRKARSDVKGLLLSNQWLIVSHSSMTDVRAELSCRDLYSSLSLPARNSQGSGIYIHPLRRPGRPSTLRGNHSPTASEGCNPVLTTRATLVTYIILSKHWSLITKLHELQVMVTFSFYWQTLWHQMFLSSNNNPWRLQNGWQSAMT